MDPEKPTTGKYLCIHGHFYQPPRENPWIEMIEQQESASPYHDWNERVTRECYGPNARSRLHGKENRIRKLINNYEYMSFNFGPTLLSWLEEKHPWIYNQILKADKDSRRRYKGHGNAIAQVYNHVIMPLASRRDKLTQIRWGVADFRYRFGRDPEGMWLAETAVDMETLDLMESEGIRFTILSPFQARAVRPLDRKDHKEKIDYGSSVWQEVSGGIIDPTRPYRLFLDKEGSRFIDIFFYDGPLSRSIAYEKVLTSGEDLLTRIQNIFTFHQNRVSLVSIATDGESYGHHFKFGEMALSWLFNHIEKDNDIHFTNYGLFLEGFPPEKEVRLYENSAWSCCHGVDRWRADCGCSVAGNPKWNQRWRAPLREGMDWLARELADIFEKNTAALLKDPWEARDDYIHVLLNPSVDVKAAFLRRHSIGSHGERDKVDLFQLLESQRMSLYMFTSCGWFFDDISGIESAQVLMYASRAMELASKWSKADLEENFIKFLVKARSNNPSYRHGGRVYDLLVKPSRIDPSLAAAHQAIASLLEDGVQGHCPVPWTAATVEYKRIRRPEIRVNIGEVKILEKRTDRDYRKIFLAVRRKAGDLSCILGTGAEPGLDELVEEIRLSLDKESLEKTKEVFSRHVSDATRYNIEDLIPEARKWLVEESTGNLDNLLKNLAGTHSEQIDEAVDLIRATGYRTSTQINGLFRILFFARLSDLLTSGPGSDEIDWKKLSQLASFCRPSSLRFLSNDPLVAGFFRWQMSSFTRSRQGVFLKNILAFLRFIRKLHVEPDLWECQNLFYDLYQDPVFCRSLNPDVLSRLRKLGFALGFFIEE